MNEMIKSITIEIEDIISRHMNDYALRDNCASDKILKEIQKVISIGNIVDGQRNDFEIVEEIVCIFEKYGINTGGCHDF